jgi:K+-transporting ATPase ATPase B chain
MSDALRKLDPHTLWKNPVRFVELGAVFTTVLAIASSSTFSWLIVVWLWLTVLFANLAEAVAESRGKAQADAYAGPRQTLSLVGSSTPRSLDGAEEPVPAPELRPGDRVVCEAGDVIPGDGDVIDGVASVDDIAITGESAPVIRESGGDRRSVTGGTRVLSDRASSASASASASSSSRHSSVSSQPRSARCYQRPVSPVWTGSCSAMCSP